MRQKGFSPVDDPPEVDVDHPLDVFELRLLDLAEVGDDGLGVGQYGLSLGDIEPVGLHRRAERFGLADRFGQPLGVDVGEREFGPLLREIDGQRPADAGSSSGDDGDFAFEWVHLATTFASLVWVSEISAGALTQAAAVSTAALSNCSRASSTGSLSSILESFP